MTSTIGCADLKNAFLGEQHKLFCLFSFHLGLKYNTRNTTAPPKTSSAWHSSIPHSSHSRSHIISPFLDLDIQLACHHHTNLENRHPACIYADIEAQSLHHTNLIQAMGGETTISEASSDPSTPMGMSNPSTSGAGTPRLPHHSLTSTSTTPTPPPPTFPKQLSEKYRLGEELGRGAYGRVYRGLDTRTGEQVAIKQISLDRIPSGTLASLVTEVELLKALNHVNVVQYLGSFRTRNHLYIIMELVENGSLAAAMKADAFGGPFPEALVGMYIQQVLQGLEYLHDQGVVHRDIKGANILTTKDGVVKLADFGVAARLDATSTTSSTSVAVEEVKSDATAAVEQEPAGTPYWMAPEVIELKTVSTASDIWSVGCLAVELFSGEPPYYDLQPLSALYNIVQNPHPPLPPTASPSMADFLMQCFRKDPGSRPNAKALLQHPWVLHYRRQLKSSLSSDNGNGISSGGGVAGGLGGGGGGSSMMTTTTEPKGYDALLSNGSKPGSVDGGGIGDDYAANNEFLKELDADEDGTRLLAALDRLHIYPQEVPHYQQQQQQHRQHQHIAKAPSSQDEADVRRQAASLRIMAAPGERSIIEEAAAAASCRSLIGYLASPQGPSLHPAFIAADGLMGIRELLDSSSERVLSPVLDLLLTLIERDVEAMELACVLGLIPAALRVSGPSYPIELRLKAAKVATALVRSSAHGAHMLVACQGVPFLLAMADDAPQSKEQLELLSAAVNGLWALLHRSTSTTATTGKWPVSTSSYLRLMAHHGLPMKIVKVLPWVLKSYVSSSSASTGGGQEGRATTTTSTPTSMRAYHHHAASKLNGSSHTTGSSSGLASSLMSTSSATADTANGPGLLTSNRIVPEELLHLQQQQHSALPPTNQQQQAAAISSQLLLDSLVSLFAALAHGDVVVKSRLCQLECINTMFGFTVRMPTPALQLRVLETVYLLSTEQSVLSALEQANAMAYVVAQLPRADCPDLQVVGLLTLHNLCQLSRSRQEAAAKAGVVPWLCRMAVGQPPVGRSAEQTEAARAAAASTLCLLAHCSPRTRAELWTHGGLDILLQLLKEEEHQVSVLEALASWLDAELPRLEGKLLEGTALARLVMVLPNTSNTSTTTTHQDHLPSLLSPLGRMISRSSRLAVELCGAGFATRIVELLKRPTPPAALALMDILQLLYEAHPRPKEFVVQHRVGPALMSLTQTQGDQVLVRTRANNLLKAFSVNAVF